MNCRTCFILFAAIWIPLAIKAQPPGVIKGRVNYVGEVPDRVVLKVAGDNVCEELTKQNPPTREDVVVNGDKTLKNVVVWVESGWPDGYKPEASLTAESVLLQQNCSFYPHILAVRTGQKVVVQNKDETLHNLNALSKNNPRLNKAMIGRAAPPVIISFPNPEVAIRIKNDIHPWMEAWIAVFDHPAFDVTGDDGRFQISNLPPGEYVLKSWHEKLGVATTTALVKAEIPSEITFEYTATGARAGGAAQEGDGTAELK